MVVPFPASQTVAVGNAFGANRFKPLIQFATRIIPAAQRRLNEAGQKLWANRPFWSRDGRRHGLPGQLIVSLTSYPPRFASLHYAIRSLLEQKVRPDRTILWIAEQDRALLPRRIHALCARGLEIRFAPDVRSYKKLVFALQDFPDAFLVTADDDILYPRDWLASLVQGHDPSMPCIVCRRAHRIRFGAERFEPYMDWGLNADDGPEGRPSADLLAVGAGGILYPPGALHPDVTRTDLFMRIAPNGDDLWFWWMGRRLGTRTKCVGHPMEYRYVAGTQKDGLWSENSAGGNDQQLAALAAAFGYEQVRPLPVADSSDTIGRKEQQDDRGSCAKQPRSG
jgi:hypothetical protein